MKNSIYICIFNIYSYVQYMLHEVYKTGIWTNTYCEGVNKGSRSQRHTAAQQGKDGVAQVIWQWIGQWSEHFSRRLHSDHILHRTWPWSVQARCHWSSSIAGNCWESCEREIIQLRSTPEGPAAVKANAALFLDSEMNSTLLGTFLNPCFSWLQLSFLQVWTVFVSS